MQPREKSSFPQGGNPGAAIFLKRMDSRLSDFGNDSLDKGLFTMFQFCIFHYSYAALVFMKAGIPFASRGPTVTFHPSSLSSIAPLNIAT